MQVLRRGEAATGGDVGDGQVLVLQALGGSGEFETEDFIMHAAAAHLAKVRFQGRA